ncbi:TetR/AcrR family transcriptional regulator [Bacillus songklensis]|uniref:TetR/AcrR family transcriptional regulator n=1 Tax=Bacillus songklensis TaxID=1069116 RepID=A0ABV8B4U5_9BACI
MRREQQKELTRKLLEDTAIRLFQKQGFAKTTVSQITSQAGVAKGTFFNYFTSKEAVLHTIREQQLQYMIQEAENIIQQNGNIAEGLCNLLEKIVVRYEKAGRTLCRSLFHVLITDDDFQGKELLQSKKFKEQLIRLFDEGKRKEEFIREISSEQMALAILHHFFGILFYWCTDEESVSLTHLISSSISLFFHGILSSK